MRTRNRGKQQAGLEPELIDGDDDEVCITMVSPPPNRPARLGGSQDGLSAPGDSVAPPPRDAWREAMKDGLDNPSVAAAAPPFGSVKVMTGGSLGLSPMMWPSSLTGPGTLLRLLAAQPVRQRVLLIYRCIMRYLVPATTSSESFCPPLWSSNLLRVCF